MNQLKLRALTLTLTLGLAGGLYAFMAFQRSQRQEEAGEKAKQARVFDFSPSAVLEVVLKNADGEFVLKREPERWVIAEPRAMAADPEGVPTMMRFVTELQRVVEVGDGSPSTRQDLSLYQLAPPRFEVTLVTLDARKTLFVGKKNRFDGNVYAMLEGSSKVFTVDGAVHFHLDKNFFDLRDKRLVPLDPETIQSFSGFGSGEEPWRFSVRKIGDRFSTAPETGEPKLLDTQAVAELLRRVTDGQATLLDVEPWSEAAASETDIGEPNARWSFSTGEQTVELWLREMENPRRNLFGSSALGIGEIVSPAVHRRLLTAPLDLEDRRLFPLDRGDFERVELQQGTSKVVLQRSDSGWTANGEPADEQRISALIYNLSRLKREGPRPSGSPQAPVSPAAKAWKDAFRLSVDSGEKRIKFELLPEPEGASWGRAWGGAGPKKTRTPPFVFDGSALGTISAQPSDYGRTR